MNDLTLEITETFKLEKFEIISILITPSVSALITIVIYASNSKLYERIFELKGDDYTAWSGDDKYVFDYIQNNILTIFTI